jgi:UDP-3-O-[3-hydroxymyristoyl] glucosamine N-acyltransferase
MRVIQQCFARPRPRGIAASAKVATTAQIADDAFVGPLCTIGENVQIGSGTVIYAGVHIYDDARIGRNVTINSGTVVGADGFGYERNAQGELEKFPHVGSVVIEDDVEIGANTCIDRGTLGDTRVCEGARLDNLVHVAHNTVIGRHAAVIADAMIGGSTKIGDYAWIAPSACLRDRIEIGDRAVVGLAAVVTKSVPEDTTVMGSPAREAGDQKRILAKLNRLALDE